MAGNNRRTKKWIQYTARVVSIIFVDWWLLFGLVSIIVAGFTFKGFLIFIVVPLLFLASVIIAWRREKIGGILLIIESLLLIFWFIWPSLIAYFQRNTSIYMVFYALFRKFPFAYPSLIAGILFIINSVNLRKEGNENG